MKPSVLCISLEALANQRVPNDAFAIHEFDLNAVPKHAFHFINRGVVDTIVDESFYYEVGETFPQILAYIIVKHGDQYLSYARKYSGESRLLGSRSVGFGGHVDLEDYGQCFKQLGDEPTFEQVIQFSIERELFEELELESVDETAIQFKGIIVDTTNTVGRVHRGLLTVIEVSDKSDVKSTKETQDLEWHTLEELKADSDYYENWSQLAIASRLI